MERMASDPHGKVGLPGLPVVLSYRGPQRQEFRHVSGTAVVVLVEDAHSCVESLPRRRGRQVGEAEEMGKGQSSGFVCPPGRSGLVLDREESGGDGHHTEVVDDSDVQGSVIFIFLS